VYKKDCNLYKLELFLLSCNKLFVNTNSTFGNNSVNSRTKPVSRISYKMTSAVYLEHYLDSEYTHIKYFTYLEKYC